MRRFGALQLPSVLAYGGIVAFLCGLLSVIVPPRWLGFSRRFHGPLTGAVVGASLFAAGWFWPAGTFTTPSPATRLDAFMPDYHFHERHEITIQAPPDRVRAALDRVSFADIGVMETLGRIRGLVVGGSHGRGVLPTTPIIETVKGPRSGFFLLDDTPRNGRSCVITETRIAASDPPSRSRMAKYWTLIYPGSGMVRRSLLEAVRAGAEKLGFSPRYRAAFPTRATELTAFRYGSFAGLSNASHSPSRQLE